MDIFSNIMAILILLCIGVVGFYLLLIAKFYRIKFSRGPNPQGLLIGMGIFLLGLVLRLPWLGFLPAYIWQGLLSIGGLIFAGLTYMLYRSMMSPQ